MIGRVLICIGVLLAFVQGVADGATCCTQSFYVICKTRGENSVLQMREVFSGECLRLTYRNIAVEADSSWIDRKSILEDRDGVRTDSIPDSMLESFISVSGEDGVFRIGDGITVGPPEYDSTFDKTYQWLVRDSAGFLLDQWERFCKGDCVDQPQFSGVKAELVYVYDRGLYKNYSIRQVIYFPESDYVIVVTDQSRLKPGLDTMHGYFVYRLIK